MRGQTFLVSCERNFLDDISSSVSGDGEIFHCGWKQIIPLGEKKVK